MTNSVPRPETIQKLGAAPFPAFAMLAGMQLELFTPLGAGAMTAEQLAKALGVGEAKLTPLLYALASAGLLTVDNGRFANTLEADRYLVRGKPTYLGDRHLAYTARYHEAAQTAATIRTGQPQARRDYASLSTEEFDDFLRQLHPSSRAAGRDLLTRFDFSGYRNMVDVAGGSGGLALAIATACPQIRVTVIDLPSVTSITRRFIEEESMTGRVDAVAGDVVRDPLPGRYDVAVLRSVIQVLPPDDARRVLHNLIQALEPGAPVFLIGQVLDDSRLSPPETVAYNLVFINQHDGQAYIEKEYRTWLTETGFTSIERVPFSGGSSLITARKPV